MNWQERLEAARAQQVPGPGCRSGAKAGTSGVRIGCQVSAWTPCSAQAFGCLSRAGVTSRLPERFLQAPCPRDHGEGSGTPSPLGDPPALPERIGCGKEAAIPRRTAETCGNLSAQWLHPPALGRETEAGAQPRGSAPGLVPRGAPRPRRKLLPDPVGEQVSRCPRRKPVACASQSPGGNGGVSVLATLGPGAGPGALGCGRLRPVTAAFGFGSGTSGVLNDRFGSLRGLLSSEHLRNWANFQKFRADVAALAPGIARQAPTLSASAAGGRSPCSHPGTRQESGANDWGLWSFQI